MFREFDTAAARSNAENLGEGQSSGLSKNDLFARLLLGMIILCTLVTAGAMFSGFLSMGGSGPVEVALSALFTVVIAAGLGICATLIFVVRSKRLKIMFFTVWAFAAAISVTMSFGLYFDLTSAATAARSDVRSAVRAAVEPLTMVQAAMQRTSRAADAIASYSNEQALLELRGGGTCDGVKIAAPGPRRDLRLADAAAFKSAAAQLRGRAGEVAKQAQAARNIALTYDPKRHAAAVGQVDDAYSQVRALTGDGALEAWKRKVEERIAAAEKPFVSAAGKPFYCRDPGLVARLRDAAAIGMPALPAGPPAMTEPTHGESVRRGLALASFQRPFDKRLDLLPTMLGLALDVMLLLFSGAHAVVTGFSLGTQDQDGESDPASPIQAILRRIRRIGPDEINFVQTLDEALLTGKLAMLDAYDAFSVQRDGYDYMLVPLHGGGEQGELLRGLAQVLREDPDVRLHLTSPFSALPGRIREDLQVKLGKNVQIALYEVKRETIARYKLADIARLMRARNGARDAEGAPLKVVTGAKAGGL